MSYFLKKFVCLSKSRKIGGFCFAGKEILKNGDIGEWLRPVSDREDEEISHNECKYEDDCLPELLDIIEVPFKKPNPTCHQCENYLIDDGYCWEKVGNFNREDLNLLLDSPDVLWGSNNSSYYGINDRVDECFLENLDNSLYFITPTSLSIDVITEGKEFNNPRRKVRARLIYNEKNYLLPVTDPDIEKRYLKKEDGQYIFRNPESRVFICVSMGKPHQGYCWEFVASVIK